MTVLYPFMAPDQVDDEVLERLRDIAHAVPCFSYRLAQTRRFPVALYLGPDPDASFPRSSTASLPPFPTIRRSKASSTTVVPHVTVAHGDEALLCSIEIELRIALAAGGGLRARCTEVVLIENSSGRWEPMHTFPLG